MASSAPKPAIGVRHMAPTLLLDVCVGEWGDASMSDELCCLSGGSSRYLRYSSSRMRFIDIGVPLWLERPCCIIGLTSIIPPGARTQRLSVEYTRARAERRDHRRLAEGARVQPEGSASSTCSNQYLLFRYLDSTSIFETFILKTPLYDADLNRYTQRRRGGAESDSAFARRVTTAIIPEKHPSECQ